MLTINTNGTSARATPCAPAAAPARPLFASPPPRAPPISHSPHPCLSPLVQRISAQTSRRVASLLQEPGIYTIYLLCHYYIGAAQPSSLIGCPLHYLCKPESMAFASQRTARAGVRASSSSSTSKRVAVARAATMQKRVRTHCQMRLEAVRGGAHAWLIAGWHHSGVQVIMPPAPRPLPAARSQLAPRTTSARFRPR